MVIAGTLNSGRLFRSHFLLFASLLFNVSALADGNFHSEDNLTVFVGSVISSVDIPCDSTVEDSEDDMKQIRVCFDAQLRSKFRVHDVVFGDYDEPEIEIISFDHHGRFPFRDVQYSLMYVSKHDASYIQQKYQYDAVYKTADGGWAGCGHGAIEPDRYPGADAYEPYPIEFEQPVTIDLEALYDQAEGRTESIDAYFSAPNFKVEDNQVTCLRGLSALELFEIRNTTVLAARRGKVPE